MSTYEEKAESIEFSAWALSELCGDKSNEFNRALNALLKIAADLRIGNVNTSESGDDEAGRNRYRIVETKDQEGRSWYHAEEGYDVENWHIVHDIKKCDDPLLIEERLRNYSHHRIVKKLTL